MAGCPLGLPQHAKGYALCSPRNLGKNDMDRLPTALVYIVYVRMT